MDSQGCCSVLTLSIKKSHSICAIFWRLYNKCRISGISLYAYKYTIAIMDCRYSLVWYVLQIILEKAHFLTRTPALHFSIINLHSPQAVPQLSPFRRTRTPMAVSATLLSPPPMSAKTSVSAMTPVSALIMTPATPTPSAGSILTPPTWTWSRTPPELCTTSWPETVLVGPTLILMRCGWICT